MPGSSLIIERTTVHVSDDTGRIAMLETRTHGKAADDNNTAQTLTRYIYSNHLQSAALELDETGAIISYEEYHPYGTTSYQAMNAAIKAVAKRYRYTGKERDEESGLYYHGAGYYIPWLCRWSACDPLESKYAGLSPYNYGFNNPVKWTDSTGMGPDDPPKSPPVGSQKNPIMLPEVKITAKAINPGYGLTSMPQAVTSVDNLRVFRLNNPPKQQYFFSDKEYYAYKATKAEPTILAADMYGTGHIGPAAQVKSIIASIKQEHVNAVFENIRGGFFGSLGYVVGGEQGSFSGARLDQAMAAAVAMRSTEPVNPVEQRFVAQTETPKTTVGTGTQLKLSMEQAAEVNPAFAAKGGSNIKYLGRMEDLEGIPRSQTILDELTPSLGSPKADYYRNMSVIRKNLRDGVIFKDASWFRPNSELAPTFLNPNRTVGQTFFGAERNLMTNKGLWP